ncbi:MAG: Tm-1-like ATP-binding domain-containing protein [Prosthecobacter sp.]|nr:Tm-1-like ATP-binding domain-containing protein [Prosthecobacter sp.]
MKGQPTQASPAMPTIAILGTFDTKGAEHGFIADQIRARGFETLLINAGSLAEPTLRPDIPSHEVAAAGAEDWQAVLARQDRGECVTLMERGAEKILAGLVAAGRVQGVISLGGGGGTAICTAAMRALPIGFPKLMVSTLACGNTAPYVGTKDIVMMPAIADVAGINRLTRVIFENAAGAICGMVQAAEARRAAPAEDKPLIVASMFGNTTACVTEARRLLEEAGYEVLVFAATGAGGRAMEALIESGLVAGVLDITTTEWADELCGGVLSAGPQRLEAAARAGVPAVIAPGCLDMVNFGEPSTVPARYAGRTFYQHNAQVTLMRTTPEECTRLGAILADKINHYTAPVSVLIPTQAISVISAEGKPFHDPAADAALFSALKQGLRPEIQVQELPVEINDPAFARACVEALLAAMRAAGG